MDIVNPSKGPQRTGFLAESIEEYVSCLEEIFKLSEKESLSIRSKARTYAVSMFSEEKFQKQVQSMTLKAVQKIQ